MIGNVKRSVIDTSVFKVNQLDPTGRRTFHNVGRQQVVVAEGHPSIGGDNLLLEVIQLGFDVAQIQLLRSVGIRLRLELLIRQCLLHPGMELRPHGRLRWIVEGLQIVRHDERGVKVGHLHGDGIGRRGVGKLLLGQGPEPVEPPLQPTISEASKVPIGDALIDQGGQGGVLHVAIDHTLRSKHSNQDRIVSLELRRFGEGIGQQTRRRQARHAVKAVGNASADHIDGEMAGQLLVGGDGYGR
mmetsp:Transcript_12483/g.35733  ORF Transcript_12483/g.35733 Transcript_12483/m.35733 type:complete len:243 (-) Transcript_12483:298-1026(-)